MQLRQISYMLSFQGIALAFLVAMASIAFSGCDQTDHCSNKARCEMLDSIEGQMFQRPESLGTWLEKLDTTLMTPHEQARLGAIRGYYHFEKQEYDKSIKELEKAETYFLNVEDHYHLHICKLIKAFTFEYLNLYSNAPALYVECEDYFNAHHLDQFKFYAKLGLFRMAKPLQLDENKLIQELKNAALELNNTHYIALLYATMGVLEKSDSLKTVYYEQARSPLVSAHRWSRVYAIDLNLLFLKIKQDPSENAQIFYNNFPGKAYHYTPNAREMMRYKYAQAYLYSKQGKDKLSVEVANKVLNEAIALKINKVESDCVELLTYWYKRTGDFANAHKMLERYHALQKIKMDDFQKDQLLALGAHYRYSDLEREKVELKGILQKSKLIFGVITLILLLVILIGWLLWNKRKQKIEILRLENMGIQDQNSNLRCSLDNQGTENERLKLNTKELQYQNKDLLRKKEFLEVMDKKEVKTWMEYELFFHELQPGWIEKLKQAVPDLTATDLKYCICFYFNLNNFTIAKLFGSEADSVKAAKKRIRKKLALNDAKQIYLFLKKID